MQTMRMQTLTAQIVPQQQDYTSPFDDGTPGFRHEWWIDQLVHARNPDHCPYSFIDGAGEEVARVLLHARAGFVDLEDAGVALPADAVSVERLEVRADLLHPRRGVGTRVIRELEFLHPVGTLFAFSEDADDFWHSTGWKFMPRRDGRTSYRAMFVYTARGDLRYPAR
jgi:hypothetical protein